MKKWSLFLIVIFHLQLVFAQNIICPIQDREAFATKMEAISQLEGDEVGDNMVAIGKMFMGTPYVAKTLEIGITESLVINLHQLDCTTFVENVLAFNLMLQQLKTDFESFTHSLETIRYKNGKLDGYASRLHYFSEWIANNEKKGFLKNITSEIGGVEINKEINFMSAHRDLYPFLKNEDNFKKIQASEKFLNHKSLCILPRDQIEANEHLIRSGDIIALTTSINGLDITHTGIASREADGRIHLLHASTGSMEVEVSQQPLSEYLKGIKKNTGIMVARPL